MPVYPPIAGAGPQVNMTHHHAPYGAMGTHSVRYLGLGAAALTHRGYLDYHFDVHALYIHTVDAQPQGAGLGSLLLFEAADRATFHGVNRIVALAVAATARGFYLRSGFHPSRAGRNAHENVLPTPVVGPNFELRLLMARNIGDWEAERLQVHAAAYQEINGTWI